MDRTRLLEIISEYGELREEKGILSQNSYSMSKWNILDTRIKAKGKEIEEELGTIEASLQDLEQDAWELCSKIKHLIGKEE